jgi:hypothetical protein
MSKVECSLELYAQRRPPEPFFESISDSFSMNSLSEQMGHVIKSRNVFGRNNIKFYLRRLHVLLLPISHRQIQRAHEEPKTVKFRYRSTTDRHEMAAIEQKMR